MLNNLYFDTEFTGLRNGTKLISIGCIFRGRTFYAESNEWVSDIENIDKNTLDFLKKEVIPGLVYYNGYKKMVESDKDEYNNCISMIGSEDEIAQELIKWIVKLAPKNESHDNRIIIIPVSDVMYYDMVLFNDLIKSGLNHDDLKTSCDVKNIIFSPYGIDICNLISLFEKSNPYEAFDVNREELLDKLDPLNNREFFPIRKHNSLYDARVIKSIYETYMTSVKANEI